MRNWIEGAPILLTMIFMGSGMVAWAWRGGSPLSIPELIGWSWLAGTAATSFLLAGLGPLLPKPLLVPALIAIGGASVLAAVWRRRRGPQPGWFPTSGAAWERWISLVLLVPVIWTFKEAFSSPLVWDALFIWEFKARIAFLGGGLPHALFTDPTRIILHPAYPLYLPMCELSLYLGAGHCDQTTVKTFFPPFYFAATALLWGGAARVTGRLWTGVAAAFVPAFVPELSPGSGALLSGYADYPVGVYYLAAISALTMGGAGKFREREWGLAAGASAVLPWIKQEGVLLWACFAVVSAIVCGPRRWKTALWIVLPGAVVTAGWKLALRVMHVPAETTFSAIDPASIRLAWSRVLPVAGYFLHELGNVDHWSLLWILFVPALVCLCWRRAFGLALGLAVLLPLGFDFAPYLFTRLDLAWHLEKSCARLVVQDSLTAVLAIAAVLIPVQRPDRRTSSEILSSLSLPTEPQPRR